MKLSEFLDRLEFHNPKKSSEYVGKKETNPVMVLEENVSIWIQQTNLDDLQSSLKIFEDRVCIQGFPAIYSPQFWIANASLTAINEVMNGYLNTLIGLENEGFLSEMLFDTWIKLLNAGPGSTHLHMLNIILKSPDDLLWKYLESLKGDNLKTLIRTLRTDFMYKEDVSPDHYATLMETHIDKVFRSIFTSNQFEESRRELLDLQIYYLSRMNHVPPHIGPRLSHLCFLICNRYEMENPYLGIDDWVIMRQHLKFIKDVITHSSFTKASEAQYRGPIVLEKILHAAVVDKMLDVMLKDFMTMLQTITKNTNSKMCRRLYTVYQTGLFEHINLKRGFEECPYWLFTQCMQMLAQLANSNMLESHIDEFIITTQNDFLLKFTKLSKKEIEEWHKLLVSYIVSGRRKLVMEAKRLLSNRVLIQNGVLDWKKYVKEARMLIDIVSDLPKEFLQNNEESSLIQTAETYSKFLQELFNLILNMEEGTIVVAEIRPNVHRCIVKCIEKDMEAKAVICLSCVNSTLQDFTDLIFVREVLFSIEKLLKEEDCPRSCDLLTETICSILDSCLQNFRTKGYIPVDFNSLLMSLTLRCVTVPDMSDDVARDTMDIFDALFKRFVPAFVEMHCDKGSLQTIAQLVFQTLCAIQEARSQDTGYGRSIDFLKFMGTKSVKLLKDQIKLIMELFIDWYCVDLRDIIKQLYKHCPNCLMSRFQEMFNLVTHTDFNNKHKLLDILYTVSTSRTKLFQESHIQTLLEIYPVENEPSQAFIIKIILEVFNHNPNILASHVDILVDEMIFSTTYFRERCTIMSTMFSINSELAQKTEDFLMKYITHTDDRTSLLAMQTLVPLIRPCLLPSRKLRLKVLLKSIKCDEARAMCEELVPAVKNNNHMPIAIQQQRKVKDIKVKTTPKPVPVKTALKTSSQNVNLRAVNPQANQDKGPQSPNSTRTKDGGISGRKDDLGVKQIELSTSETILKSINGETVDGSLNETLNKNVTSILTKDSVKENIKLPMNDKGDATSQKSALLQDLKPTYTNSTDFKPTSTNTTSVSAVTNISVDHNIQTKYHSRGIIPDGNSSDILSQQLQNTIINSDDDLHETIANLSENGETKSISRMSFNSESPKSVSIYGSVKDKSKLVAFSGVLKDAGFSNNVVCKESDVGELEEARLIIICLSKEIHTGMIDKIVQVLDGLKTLIFIKLDSTSSPANQHTERTCIRMFTKPGETTLRRQWPALKFYEVLMHLNYHGILPMEHLLSQDFIEWWMPVESIRSKSLTKTHLEVEERRTSQKNTAATLFFSYHWGKQKQVEPLYKYLIDHGISCWVGLQQVGGSESLYNKISQGIQECRVLLACVTPQYTCTENCQHEVNIAFGLNRPVIPLLVQTIWPIKDKTGEKLEKQECLKMEMTADGKIDVTADVIKCLLKCIKKYVPEVKLAENDRKNVKIESIKKPVVDKKLHTAQHIKKKSVHEGMQPDCLSNTEQEVSVDHLTSDLEPVKLKNGSKIHKSASFGEIDIDKSMSKLQDVRGGSKSEMEVDRRKSHYDIPDGVIVDEYVYTDKISRSKSCKIL